MRSLVTDRIWTFNPPNLNLVSNIKKNIECTDSFAQILAVRSDQDPQFSHRLLEFDLSSLHSPFKMDGIESALQRLKKARASGEKLFIHGDFDVDGLTSSSLLYMALRGLGFDGIKVEVGNRAIGHGINSRTVKKIIDGGFDLLITCDCGINNHSAVKTLKENGVDTIITDHHNPPPNLPHALAILNPKLESCNYPNKFLAGVGVAYKLISAFMQEVGLKKKAYQKYLDLVMLGTVADLVPLVKDQEVENKLLVAGGLKKLAQGGGNRGLKILIEKLSLKTKELTAGRISYIVAPHLNAANRVGDPRVAFLLLTTDKKRRASFLADALLDYNRDRQIGQDELKSQADELLISGKANLEDNKIIVLDKDNWNPGIIGLIASQMVEEHGLPAILISKKSRISQASCRSIPGFNMIECLEKHENLFVQYGGHEQAAGFTIKNGNIPALKEEIKRYAHDKLAGFTRLPSSIDAKVLPEEIDLKLHEEILKLSPFGMGNPKPRFITDEAKIEKIKPVGSQNRHLKFTAKLEGRDFEVIGYRWGRYEDEVSKLHKTNLIFRLGVNNWMGKKRVQLELEDIV